MYVCTAGKLFVGLCVGKLVFLEWWLSCLLQNISETPVQCVIKENIPSGKRRVMAVKARCPCKIRCICVVCSVEKNYGHHCFVSLFPYKEAALGTNI